MIVTASECPLDADALLESPRPWEQMFDALGVILVALDAGGRIVLFNRTAERTSGYDRGEVLGQSVIDLLVAPDRRAEVRAILDQLFAEPSVAWHIEVPWTARGDEQRLIRWAAASLAERDDAGVSRRSVVNGEHRGPSWVVGIGVDITRERRLEQEAVEADERLRQQFGTVLYDMLASNLAGTAMMASALTCKLERGEPAKARETVRQLSGRVRETMEWVRTLAGRFAAPELTAEGLVDALNQLVDRTEAVSGASCSCVVAKEARPRMPAGDDARHLYRIAQEAVQRAITRSASSQVELALELEEEPFTGESLVLEVRDDGRGQPAEIEGSTSFRTMQRRARLLGATLHVERTETDGVVVRCVLPLAVRPSGA